MKSTFLKAGLFTLLLIQPTLAAKKKIDVEAEIVEYLKVSKVRADCTVQMIGQGVPQERGFIFCDCMVSVISRNYSREEVLNASRIPRGELLLIQEHCGNFTRNIGEKSSPDKAQ